ncbi:MAG: nucleotidyltransferase family protein, partial [Gemmatimonadaceae bacterium]
LAVRMQLRSLLAELRARGVEVTLLKGAAFLATRMRPHRPCTDLDLLVRAEDVERACGAMTALGYRSRSELRIDGHHHLPPFVRADALPVELHLRTLNRELARDDVTSSSRALEPGVLVLHPTEWCWHALAHEARHHDLAGRVRGALDVAALCERCGGDIDWTAIAARARGWPDDIGVVALSVRALCPDVPLRVGVASRIRAACLTYGRERAARGAASDRAFAAAMYRLGMLVLGSDGAEDGEERVPARGAAMRYVPAPVSDLASLMAITLGRDVS